MSLLIINNDQEMQDFGATLARSAKAGDIFLLEGELGAGKTTLVRGFLRALGFQDKVKSPSYTLVESYNSTPPVHHFDFYRLVSIEQLEEIGFQEYLTSDAICLIEWPALAEPLLPENVIRVSIEMKGEIRCCRLNNIGDPSDISSSP